MGRYQGYRGNPENKLFYLLDQLIGGINTDFSDDTSPDNEFKSIINFTMDKRGSLFKRMGFGKLNAVSEIFNMFKELPDTKATTSDNVGIDVTNDNIVYMKMLINDNNCFRNLSSFVGDKAYRKYQELYGAQNNGFKLLIITTNYFHNKSKAWIYSCRLPRLNYDDLGNPTDEDTIEIEENVQDLPVLFKWNKNLCNIETIEFFDKIYFTSNDKGLVCFNRKDDTFTYTAKIDENSENTAYKPSPMEVRKVGFNVLGDNPLYWIDYQGISTNSIQGIYITSLDNKPLTVIPSGNKFRINVLYTGDDKGFTITYKEGEKDLQADTVLNEDLSATGLKVYEVTFKTAPTSQVEIKINKTGAEISDYYDYYDVGNIDPETKVVERLNIGDYGVCEMYNRAVYYKDDTIWFSEINNFSYVPNYNYIALPIEPTDKITKIIYFRNVYIIFTKQRIYKMIGSFGDSNFQVMPLNLSMGCHAPNTIVPIENVLYFASPRGLYQLVSIANYTTTSNTFENVKEIDTKIKQLTSDVTLYVGEISDPAIRYKGISENAYGIRYKDKYMLFYNNIENDNDRDVLVYQYELKAFSEMKFPVKPTFLFMIDGIIETYCKVPEKEEYSEEELILSYDFEDLDSVQDKIKDLSGNGNDAIMSGGVVVSPGTGILMNGDGTYIKTGTISDSFDLTNGFNVKVNCQVNKEGTRVYDLKQNSPLGRDKVQNFNMTTNSANGYKGIMSFEVIPNPENNSDLVNWTLTWTRTGTNINASQSGKINLVDSSSNKKLIDNIDFTFNLGSSLSKVVANGSFVVEHNESGYYSGNWNLSISSKYPVYSTGWSKGSPISFNVTQDASWSNKFGIKIAGTATAYNGGCTVTYTPYLVVKQNASISIGARNLYVNIGGNGHNHTVGSASGSGYKEFSGGQQSQNFNYNSNGESGFVDASFDLRATIDGVYRQSIEIPGFNIKLPKSKSYQNTEWKNFTLSATNSVIFNKINKPIYGNLALEVVNNHTVKLLCNSLTCETEKEITNEDITTLGNNEWSVDYILLGDSIKIDVYIGTSLFGSTTVSKECVGNYNRDNSVILKDNLGSINYFCISNVEGKIIEYLFSDGSGNILTDNTKNNLSGSIVGDISWTNENGIKFNGKDGYLILPVLDENNRFSNGFTIEFEGKFVNIDGVCKVFDIATSYDVSESNKCPIYLEYSNDKLILDTISASNKRYKIATNAININERHKWKFSVIDSGTDYTVSVYCDDILINSEKYNYGGITNITRRSNFIGKSNDPDNVLFNGILYNFKVTINSSPNPSPIYEGAIYEYDTTYDDFGKPMEILLETKGINLMYPMHVKKLKNIFVKGLGGYSYNDFFFEVYSDGYLVNDPRKYNCYVDENTHQVVYNYTENKELSFNEMISILGNMRLDKTRFGNGDYETKKLIIPAKGKNFKIKLYGESGDRLSIDSFGFVFKLGKVREK